MRTLAVLAAAVAALTLAPFACAQSGSDAARPEPVAVDAQEEILLPQPPPEQTGPEAPAWLGFEPVVALPDTPAGRRVAWLLDAFRGGDIGPIEARATQRVINEVGVEGFRGFIEQGREAAGWLFPTHIIASEPESLTLYLRSAADNERWVLRVETNPEEPEKIDSLVFQPAETPPIDRAADWAELAAMFEATGYDHGVTVWELREGGAIAPVASINDKTPLNISGAVSVFVLGAVTQKIAAGEGSWEEPVAIRDELRSVPQSPLRDAATGSEHLVASLAGQMLQGDDTATDHLIDWVGLDAVQAFAEGVRDDSPVNEPFLTTRDAFALKLSFNTELRDEYAQADAAARREMLAGFETPDAEILKLWVKPQDIDKVGHFASSRELASVLLYLRNAALAPGMEALREVLGANQQLRLDSGYWRSVAFTAGAEPGVLTVCLITERYDGRWFVVSVIVNDPEGPLSPQATSPAVLALIDLLQRY